MSSTKHAANAAPVAGKPLGLQANPDADEAAVSTTLQKRLAGAPR